MYIPAARERIEIAGRSGLFLVLSVDSEAESADVVSLADDAFEENVPFTQLRPYRRDVPLETT